MTRERAARIGRTSIGLDHRLTAARAEGPSRLVATCHGIIVRYDYATERAVPFADATVEAIEADEGRRLRS